MTTAVDTCHVGVFFSSTHWHSAVNCFSYLLHLSFYETKLGVRPYSFFMMCSRLCVVQGSTGLAEVKFLHPLMIHKTKFLGRKCDKCSALLIKDREVEVTMTAGAQQLTALEGDISVSQSLFSVQDVWWNHDQNVDFTPLSRQFPELWFDTVRDDITLFLSFMKINTRSTNIILFYLSTFSRS